jgi:hypothetical protein
MSGCVSSRSILIKGTQSPNGTNSDLPGTTSVAYTGGLGGLLSFMLGFDGYVYVSNSNGIFCVVPH